MKNWLGNLWLLTKRFFTRDPGGMGEPPDTPAQYVPTEGEPGKAYPWTPYISTSQMSDFQAITGIPPEALVGGLAGLVQNSVAIQHGLCDLCRTMQPIREYRGHFYCDYCGELWRQTYQDEHAD